jgi:ribonuclease PH
MKTTPKRGNTTQRTVTAIVLAVLAALLVPTGVIAGIIALAVSGSWLTGLLFLGISWGSALISFIVAVSTGLFAGKSLIENSEADKLAEQAQANLEKMTDRLME